MELARSVDLIAAAIDRARLAFDDALRSGDATAAADVYAEDATLVAPSAAVVHGRDAIERFWRTGVETGIERFEHHVQDVSRRGDVAFEVGEYALRVAPETGSPVVDRGRYLIVHCVDPDGRWRRAAEMFSPDRLPAPETS